MPVSRTTGNVLLLVGLLCLATASAAPARPELPRLIDAGEAAAPATPAFGAPTDSLFLLGGPGVLTGKFQDAAGQPDRQDWTGVDMTRPDPPHWRVSDFQADALDPVTPGNHAWWCGDILESCGGDDPPEGYGSDWIDFLDWYGTVPDPGDSVTVRVQASLLCGFEPGEEYLYLSAETPAGMQTLRSWTNILSLVDVDESITLPPDCYVGENSDQVHLRWSFHSDGAWDDSDCLWPSAGAAWLDLIRVHFDQGAGPVQIGWTETCEDGDPLQWQPVIPRGTGEFSQVLDAPGEADPDSDNDTPQFVFIDDGVVVPETGGYPCTSYCYGPGGYVVNPEYGLSEIGTTLHNEIWSPVLAVPDTTWNAAIFSWDEYVHSPIGEGAPYIFGIWHVRSTTDPTGQTGWSEWRDNNTVLYGDPRHVRVIHNVTDLLEPGFRCVQLALGVLHYRYYLSTDSTPAPYFDNVSLQVYRRAAPSSVLVRPDGTGDYPTIQDALNAAAEGDTVLLADGVFTGEGNRDLSMHGRAIVVRSQSGNPATCTLDAQGTAADPHRAFLFWNQEGPGSVLSGLTLTGGHLESDVMQYNLCGGAVYCDNATSPRIENCVFTDNTVLGETQFGGAVACYRSSVELRDCVFTGNTATKGGAVGVIDYSTPSLVNCLFVANEALSSGGAVYASGSNALVTITSCTFTGNVNPSYSGTLYSWNYASYEIDHTILASGQAGYSVAANYQYNFSFTCSDIWGFPLGDWWGSIADQLGVDGNLGADPLFCGATQPLFPFGLDENSPCAPEANPACGLIGAVPVSCGEWSGVAERVAAGPALELYPGSPNPFNPSTKIAFRLAEPGRVEARIYAIDGRCVRTLAAGRFDGGRHELTWSGIDDSGRPVASGVFFCRVRTADAEATTRLVLLK